MAINIEKLLQSLQAERKQRYEAGLGELRKVADMYGPDYLKGQERTALAGMEQSMVGRGLGGTTRPGAVGAGMKAGFEGQRIEARAGAGRNIAEYMANFPGAQTEAYLATGGFSGQLQEEAMRAPGGVLDPRRATAGGGGFSATAQQGLDVFGQTMAGTSQSRAEQSAEYAATKGPGGRAVASAGGGVTPRASATGGSAGGQTGGYGPAGGYTGETWGPGGIGAPGGGFSISEPIIPQTEQAQDFSNEGAQRAKKKGGWGAYRNYLAAWKQAKQQKTTAGPGTFPGGGGGTFRGYGASGSW